jgi:hypothetical protein
MSDPVEPSVPGGEPGDEEVRAQIDRELGILDAAILLVRQGVTTRVTVVNLGLGAALLESARARAGLRGVRISPEWGIGDTTRSLVVDRADG